MSKQSDDKPDAYSGIPWVNVTPEQARAHPQGKLGVILYAIAAYLIASALWKLWLFVGAGAPMALTVFAVGLPLLTGLGLIMRAPWSLVVALMMAAFTLYAFARSVGPGSDPLILLDALIAVGMIFYLLEGDKPNLIYRHRYRKYSALKDDGNV